MNRKCVAYYRVSSERQGRSGLGIEAQKKAVNEYLFANKWELLGSFEEVESATCSKKNNSRPILGKALNLAKKNKAVLIIAKLDRLARNVSFISNLMDAGVDFVACDMPNANKLTVQILAAVAEDEARRISERTSLALQAKKAMGYKLGNPQLASTLNGPRIERANNFAESMRDILEMLLRNGLTQRAMVEELNRLKIPSSRGCQWSLVGLQNCLIRLGILPERQKRK